MNENNDTPFWCPYNQKMAPKGVAYEGRTKLLKWNSMRCLIWWTIGQMSTSIYWWRHPKVWKNKAAQPIWFGGQSVIVKNTKLEKSFFKCFVRVKITISLHAEVEKYIVGQLTIWLTYILPDSFVEPLLAFVKVVKVS